MQGPARGGAQAAEGNRVAAETVKSAGAGAKLPLFRKSAKKLVTLVAAKAPAGAAKAGKKGGSTS